MFDTTITVAQLHTGMWSVRNEAGDRIGYFAFRSGMEAFVAGAGYKYAQRIGAEGEGVYTRV